MGDIFQLLSIFFIYIGVEDEQAQCEHLKRVCKALKKRVKAQLHIYVIITAKCKDNRCFC